MKLPNCVYKDGGPHQRPGGKFDYLHVTTNDELVNAIKSGWAPSLKDAIFYQEFDPVEFLKGLYIEEPTKINAKPEKDVSREDAKDETEGKKEISGKEKNEEIRQTKKEEADERKLLKLKIKQLGLAFDGRMSNETLKKMIAEAED